MFESGKDYIYRYSGRLLTGVPELSNMYSGLAINCTVRLQRHREEYNTYYMSVETPTFVRINDELQRVSSSSSDNWRELRLPEMSEVTGEHLVHLLKPIKFSMTNGEVHSAMISQSEPTWSVNFKKALVLQFQAKQDISSAVWQQQESNQVNSESVEEGLTYWKVKEETIDGVCESIYEVRELPTYVIVDRPEMIPYPEACREKVYFGMTKTRDLSKCEKRSAYTFFGLGNYGREMSGNNLDMWSRSSSTRYIACGSRGSMVIQSIINDGELNQKLLGYNTERFVTGSMQVFRLKEIVDSSNIVIPSDAALLKSMMYEYTMTGLLGEQQLTAKLNDLSQEQQIKLIQQGRLPTDLINDPEVIRKVNPRNFLAGVQAGAITSDDIMPQLKTIIKEVVRGLTEGSDMKSKQITSKIMAIARGFSMLRSKEEIASVFSELKTEFASSESDLVSMKNVFFDTLLVSGTPKSIFFIKDCIVSGEMNMMQISTFFIWMPHYIQMPTREVLASLYELVTSDKIRESHSLYNKAIMGYSTLLQKACISIDRKTRYPVNVFGEFCHANSEIVLNKWIPYLIHDLKYSKSADRRNEIIVSLGIMQHKSVLGELIPFVEGSVEGATPLNRYLAIHSLASAADSRDPTHVVPIFFAIMSNPAERTTIRIAAFNALLKMNPSMSVMQKVASLSWVIRDEELLRVINLAFFTLKRECEVHLEEEITSLCKKASLLYPLIKKTPGILPTSATVFTGDRLKALGVGYAAKTSWISGNSSFIPKDIYTEIKYFMSQFEFTPLSVGVRLSGTENLFHQVQKLLAPVTSSLFSEEQTEEQSEERQELHREWANIIEKLQLKARENGPMDGAFFMRFFESAPIFYNFDKLTAEQLREKIAPLLENPQLLKNKLCGEFPVNFQQTMDRAPNLFMIPSDMGFPINIDFHMPMAFSMRGSLKISCDLALPSVSLKAKIVANSEYSGWVGTTSPFTREYTVTGVQEQFVLNLPMTVEMNLDVPNAKLAFSIRPETDSVSGPIDVMSYHVKPFIVAKSISDLTPLTLVPGIKYLRSNEEVKKVENSFGNYLGLSLRSTVRTESPYADLKAGLDMFKLYNYNPMNVLRFSWTSPALTLRGTPSIRSHEHIITFDPTTSSTKEIQTEIKIGYGKKVQGQQQIKYQHIKVKSQQQQQQQQQQQKQQLKNKLVNLLPFEIESQDIENTQVHPRRQQKIKQALKNLNVDAGHALTFIYSTTLKGSSRPISWTHIVSLAIGKEAPSTSHGVAKSKWDIRLESESSSVKEICVKGEVDMPVLPMWNMDELRSSLIDFRYMNEIGFGTTCSESTIKVVGSAKVSHEQKEFSRQSAEARQCQKLKEERVPGAKMSEACEKTRLQAQTVDEVEFKMVYNNVPEAVSVAERRMVEYLKICLWPYIKAVKTSGSSIEESGRSANLPVMVRVLFHRETPSFDLIINKPDESIAFSSIRIPYPLTLVFPMKAGRNNAYLAAKAITGGAYTPECKVGAKSLTTFDNKTISLEVDDCFHLLSGDCSRDHSFGILIRSVKPDMNRREMKIFLGGVSILLTPSDRRGDSNSNIRVTVENEEVNVPVNAWRAITVDGQEYASIFRSVDNVFQLKSSRYNVNFMFDGTRAVIYGSQLLKNKVCGVCGNLNSLSKDDLTGPAKCMHAKAETHVASYRVQSGKCSALPQHVEKQLQQEKSQCVQMKEIPTQIVRALKAQTGKCTVVKHIVVERNNQVCISKAAVTECASACKVFSGQMVAKSVAFTCIN